MDDLKSAADAYLVRLASLRGLSEHTVRAYRSDLKDYFRFAECAGVDARTSDAIVSYAADLAGRGAAPRTVRRRLACLRSYFKDIQRHRIVDGSPFNELDLQAPRVRSLPRALGRHDAARLARAAWQVFPERNAPRELRSTALGVLVALSVGLRVSELIGLIPDDYDPGRGALRVRGKGSRDRTVFIVDPNLRKLLAIAAAKAGAGALIASPCGTSWTPRAFRQALRAFSRDAGVSRHVTPHMLRHTAATLLLEGGVDLLFLQRLLGHQDVSTTALYAHVADASLRNALERASLLAALGRGGEGGGCLCVAGGNSEKWWVITPDYQRRWP